MAGHRQAAGQSGDDGGECLQGSRVYGVCSVSVRRVGVCSTDMSFDKSCGPCNGSGWISHRKDVCWVCKGTGKNHLPGAREDWTECKPCTETGWIRDRHDPCLACSGLGLLPFAMSVALPHSSVLLETVRASEDQDFSVNERQQIAEQLLQIERHMTETYKLSDQQSHILSDGFSTIIGGLNRFGKKDWLAFTVGTLANIAVAAAFAPPFVSNLFGLVGGVVRSVLGNLPPQLLP
jgi:hypothetical protein